MSARAEMFNAWAAADVVAEGFEWHGDDAVTDAWNLWLSEGRPAGVILTAEAEARGVARVRLLRPGGSGGTP